MPALRVAIRADASARIGLGHVRRCVALAEALEELGAEVLLVGRALGVAPPVGMTAAFAELPAPDAAVPATSSPPLADWAGVDAGRDARETADAICRWGGADRIVVDHYAFDAGWHRAVAAATGAQVAVIDDIADRPLAADLLVDLNPADHARKYAGRLEGRTRILGGPRFALLSRAYRQAVPRPQPERVSSIGIFLGGIDAAGLSARVLAACRAGAGFDGPLEVATTSANPHLADLAAACGRTPATVLTIDAPDLAAFHARHDLQVGAGGGAAWERCAFGIPSVLVRAAANQAAVIPALAEAGAATAAEGDGPALDAAVAAAVRQLVGDAPRRRAMAERARALVDGQGARRVALALAAARLALRPTADGDADRLFAWRDDPATRARAHDPRPVDPAGHGVWLATVLADPQRRLWIGHVGPVDVGAIRFDLDVPAGTATVSLYLDPALYGLGLGGALLAAGEARLAQARDGIGTVLASVRADNPVSQRLFAAGGYTFHDGLWRKPVGQQTGGAQP